MNGESAHQIGITVDEVWLVAPAECTNACSWPPTSGGCFYLVAMVYGYADLFISYPGRSALPFDVNGERLSHMILSFVLSNLPCIAGITVLTTLPWC